MMKHFPIFLPWLVVVKKCFIKSDEFTKFH